MAKRSAACSSTTSWDLLERSSGNEATEAGGGGGGGSRSGDGDDGGLVCPSLLLQFVASPSDVHVLLCCRIALEISR